MIVVYSNAGLANRMFHYALYKALEVKAMYLNGLLKQRL